MDLASFPRPSFDPVSQYTLYSGIRRLSSAQLLRLKEMKSVFFGVAFFCFAKISLMYGTISGPGLTST